MSASFIPVSAAIAAFTLPVVTVSATTLPPPAAVGDALEVSVEAVVALVAGEDVSELVVAVEGVVVVVVVVELGAVALAPELLYPVLVVPGRLQPVATAAIATSAEARTMRFMTSPIQYSCRCSDPAKGP
jgi:hypothetical protein